MARRSNHFAVSPPTCHSSPVRSPSPPRQRRVRERRGSLVDSVLNLKSWRNFKSHKTGGSTSSRRDSESHLSLQVDKKTTKRSSYKLKFSNMKASEGEEHEDYHEQDGRTNHKGRDDHERKDKDRREHGSKEKNHDEHEHSHVPITPRRRVRRDTSIAPFRGNSSETPSVESPETPRDNVPEGPSGHYCYTCGVLRSDEYHELHPIDPDEEPSPNVCAACRRRFMLIKMGKARNVDPKVERDSKTRWCGGCGVIRASQHPETPPRGSETPDENLCRRCKRSVEASKGSSEGSGRSSNASMHRQEASGRLSKAPGHTQKTPKASSKASRHCSEACLHSPKASSEISKGSKRSSKAYAGSDNASEESTEASDWDEPRLPTHGRPVTPSNSRPVKPILKSKSSSTSVGNRSVRFELSSSDGSSDGSAAPSEPSKKSVPISEQFYSQFGGGQKSTEAFRSTFAASGSFYAHVNAQTQEYKSSAHGTKQRAAPGSLSERSALTDDNKRSHGSSRHHDDTARDSPKPPKTAHKASAAQSSKPLPAAPTPQSSPTPQSMESQPTLETEEDRRKGFEEWYAAQRKAFDKEQKQQQQQSRAPPTPPSTPPNTPFGMFTDEKLGVWDTDEHEECWIKMDDRLRAETEARLFAAAAAAHDRPRAASVSSNEDDTPPTPRAAIFSAYSPSSSSSDVYVSPKLPQAVIWEVSSAEAAEIEAENASRHSPCRRFDHLGGWN
ncbi:hypothetical protein B0T14DRAFT_550683 [Immersiella caudata]|uniref:Stc1 domain-containing protein n=1 Tax=Immersiella caudata TaxID=314043 RepID=A0AA40CC66_9PEZI|nr:hypothetical protein B0T14DRAFT_550683 [Immersiella caudata]